jgi:cytochrome c-type biogenesis protein CcmH/NrfG
VSPIPYPFIAVPLLFALVLAVANFITGRRRQKKLDELSILLVRQSQGEASTPKFLWELHRAFLDEYFEVNRKQVSFIFSAVLSIMVAGFSLVIYGGYLAVHGEAMAIQANRLANPATTEARENAETQPRPRSQGS